MFDTLYSQVGAVFTGLVILLAFWKGEEPEKIAAAAYGLGWLGSGPIKGIPMAASI